MSFTDIFITEEYTDKAEDLPEGKATIIILVNNGS